MAVISYVVQQVKKLLNFKQSNASSTLLYDDFNELEEKKEIIEKVLTEYGISAERIIIKPGRIISNFEVIPQKGAKPSKLRNLEQDIIHDIEIPGTRMINPTPERGTITFEIPNDNRTIYSVKKGLKSKELIESPYDLPCLLGMEDDPMIVDLTKVPHFIACGDDSKDFIHTALLSMISTKSPEDLKLVLIDTINTEFTDYAPLACPYLAKLKNEEGAIITDKYKAVMAIKALNELMSNRYNLLRDAQTENIKHYNKLVAQGILKAEDGHKHMPYYVVAIVDYADLTLTVDQDFEMEIARLAQLSRAVGIHVIMSTYMLDSNVQTGIIKANFPGRIVSSAYQEFRSHLVIDASGAEYLLDTNDYLANFGDGLKRLTSYGIDTMYDVRLIIKNILTKLEHEYEQTYLPEVEEVTFISKIRHADNSLEPSIKDVANLLWQEKSTSVSFIQRTYGLGYNKTTRIMDELECAGIVGPIIEGKPREFLVSSIEELHQKVKSITK